MNPTLKPWIRWVRDEEATGALRRFYDEAVKRAGRIWNIVRIMSLRPQALTTSIGLYLSVVQTRSLMLGRAEREMIAVVVSQANACHY
jgi:alkylhydroperoxidase family enzyme